MNKSGFHPVKFSDAERGSDSGSPEKSFSQITIEPDSDSEECFSEITIELDSGSGECSSQVTIEPTSPEPTSSKPTSSKLKPYPYRGKKDDPNFFDFSPESIAEYEASKHKASKLNQEKSANNRDFCFNNNNSHSQKEAEKKKRTPMDYNDSWNTEPSCAEQKTEKQKSSLCRLFCCW